MVTGTDINAPTPLLDRVSSPDDLKSLSDAELVLMQACKVPGSAEWTPFCARK